MSRELLAAYVEAQQQHMTELDFKDKRSSDRFAPSHQELFGSMPFTMHQDVRPLWFAPCR